jgi:tRNA (adenine22-N1)-methyltransferase
VRRAFLDPRLAAVASFVPAGARVADVGADHGLLAVALLQSNTASTCVATEATPKRLQRLADRLGDHGLGERLALRSGDGLEALTAADRLDVLVLAGLGGSSMVRILSHPRREELGIRRLVLQPATDAALVRRWIVAAGLATMDERLAEVRGRYHVVVAAERGAAPWPRADLDEDDVLEAGPALLARRDPALLPYWRETLERQRAILREASPGRGYREALRLRAVAQRVLAVLEESRRVS